MRCLATRGMGARCTTGMGYTHIQRTNTEASGSPFAVPAGTNPAQPHWYGGLHVPATSTSKGYFEWYFDHKKVGNRISWNKYNAASPPPPAKGSTAYAVMDERNLYWIAG